MTAATAQFEETHITANDERDAPLPLRADTILGVCEAIGQDLGFNPNWLRIPFAALILWNPTAIVGCYLGLGVVVALSRWFFPAKSAASAKPRAEAAAGENTPAVESRETEELLAA